MIIAWALPLAALVGISMAFINGMLSENLYPDYLYVVMYYAILSIPIFILDGMQCLACLLRLQTHAH